MSETNHDIAESIVRRGLPYSIFDDEADYQQTKTWLTNEVKAALNAERERCAKIIQDRIDQYALLRSVEGDVVRVFGKQMIEAVRGSNH